MNQDDGSKPNRNTWLREAAIYGLLFGLPLLFLFPFTSWRPDAEFQASLRTGAVDFTIGKYNGSGPFVTHCADVSFDRGAFSKIVFPVPVRWNPASKGVSARPIETLYGGTVELRHVDFQTLLTAPETRLKLRWNENSPEGLLIGLTYPEVPAAPGSVIALSDKSSLDFVESRLSQAGPEQTGTIASPGEVQGAVEIYSSGARLALSVSPCKEAPVQLAGERASNAAKSISKATAPSSTPATPTPATLPVSDGIPLWPGSKIAFLTDENESAILEGNNTLEVKNADRKETLFRGQRLEIAGLKERTSKDHSLISLQVKDGIFVNVVGRAGTLKVDEDDARPSLAEYLRAQQVLSAWLATSVLIGSALLTVVSRIKLVKLDDK